MGAVNSSFCLLDERQSGVFTRHHDVDIAVLYSSTNCELAMSSPMGYSQSTSALRKTFEFRDTQLSNDSKEGLALVNSRVRESVQKCAKYASDTTRGGSTIELPLAPFAELKNCDALELWIELAASNA